MHTMNFLLSPPKSGTTSVWKYIQTDGSISVGTVKEPKFICRGQYGVAGPGDKNAYINKPTTPIDYFKNYDDSQICFDCSTDNFLFPEAVHKWASENVLNPSPKAIVILRNPISRLVSGYNMQVRDGFETLGLNEALVAENNRRKSDWGVGWWYLNSSLYYERCSFIKKNFDARFYFFEDIFRSQAEFRLFMLDAFGISQSEIPVPFTNVSGSPTIAFRASRAVFRSALRPFGLRGEGKIVSRISRKLLKRQDRAEPVPDWALSIVKRDVEKLAAIIPSVERWSLL